MHKNISRLHFITDGSENIFESGVTDIDWIQLRIKSKEAETVKQKVLALKSICARNNARLIINDYAEIAKETGAHGIHLGKEDMSISSARKLLGDEIIIGSSTNSFEDILKGCNDGADYLGLGPFRFTNTKTNLNPILGLNGFETIMNEYHRAHLRIPVIAIGGITPEDMEPLLQLGIYGVAVSSAIHLSKNKTQTVRNFLTVLNKSSLTTH